MNISGKLSYKDKKVFVGIDVHRESYMVSCISDMKVVKSCRMKAEPFELLSFLNKQFPGAEIHSVYEAGFSGYGLHRYLVSNGIKNIVVNAGSIEISSNNRVKTDKRDSLKQATQLAAGRLKSINIPSKEQENKRLLSRTREQVLNARTRVRNQIRFKLHQFSLIPREDRRKLNKKFVEEVLAQELSPELRISIEVFLNIWNSLDLQLDKLNQALREQAKQDSLESIYRSASGVGIVSARTLSNELGDMSQFPNEKALFSYTGLTPSEFSSGEKRRLGHISRQGNSRPRRVLVECAWVAIKKDRKLRADFERISICAGKKRAIVAIARKLIGRIRAAIREQELYLPGHGMVIE